MLDSRIVMVAVRAQEVPEPGGQCPGSGCGPRGFTRATERVVSGRLSDWVLGLGGSNGSALMSYV
jgi:hypothetical protein